MVCIVTPRGSHPVVTGKYSGPNRDVQDFYARLKVFGKLSKANICLQNALDGSIPKGFTAKSFSLECRHLHRKIERLVEDFFILFRGSVDKTFSTDFSLLQFLNRANQALPFRICDFEDFEALDCDIDDFLDDLDEFRENPTIDLSREIYANFFQLKWHLSDLKERGISPKLILDLDCEIKRIKAKMRSIYKAVLTDYEDYAFDLAQIKTFSLKEAFKKAKECRTISSALCETSVIGDDLREDKQALADHFALIADRLQTTAENFLTSHFAKT